MYLSPKCSVIEVAKGLSKLIAFSKKTITRMMGNKKNIPPFRSSLNRPINFFMDSDLNEKIRTFSYGKKMPVQDRLFIISFLLIPALFQLPRTRL